jgi:hypothetical protein
MTNNQFGSIVIQISNSGYFERQGSTFAFNYTIVAPIPKVEDRFRTEVLSFAAVTSSRCSARTKIVRAFITMEQKPELNCVAELYNLLNILTIH